MKTNKIILGLGLGVSLLGNFAAHAQSGLQGIIVEKYYKANAADAADATDPVSAGSTTYRIYVDLAPGYQLQAVYGDAAHTLSLSTTTGFWNNSQRDSYLGDNPAAQLKNSTVALDSWITLGSVAAGNNWGVPKSEDNGAANLITNNGAGHVPATELANTPASIGIPLATQDGIIATAFATPSYNNAGITAQLQASFQSGNANGVNFSTNNGAWATTDLDTGATATNKVLIAQLTTNGMLSFLLNLQIKNIATSVVEKWVPNSPGAGEFALAALSQSNIGAAPTVSITSPANAASFFTGNPVAIAATAADADGTVSGVDFYLDGALQGSDATAPYTFTITPATVGTHSLTAKATDNDGNITTSSVVTIIEAVNAVPTATVTAPANSAVIAGALGAGTTTVTITANAADSDGTVDSVQFLVNNVKVGSAAGAGPYSFNWVSSGIYGAKAITVKAFDNNNGVGTSAAVNITISNPNAKPYFVDNTDTTCVITGFSLPIKAKDPVANVIGFDMVLHYNKAKVTPTGVITAGSDLINPSYVTISNSVNAATGSMNISVSLNNTAPNNTFFSGIGQLIAVGFNKTAGFSSIDTAVFTIDSITESRYTGVANIMVDPGKYITHKDSTFHGSLVFWADNSPIQGGVGTLPTSIAATYSLAPVVNPDAAGNFSYVVNQSALSSLHFNITRAITNTVSVQPVVNGFDALLAKKVVMKDASFVPSIYQILAMDVNQDGIISAGDVTQINQRSVMLIPEYKQAWNYNAAGVNTAGKPSRDWVFVDGNTLSTNGTYLISSVYPAADGAGYTRDNVPVPATNIAAAITNSGSCPVISHETYTGVMLGDVNGNYKDIAVDGMLRSVDSSKIVFDLSKAFIANGYATIPVSVVTPKVVNALDFAVQFINGVSYQSVGNVLPAVDGLGNFNSDDATLRFTSNSMQNYDVTQPVVSVVVATNNGQIKTSDLTSTEGYVNGNPASVEVRGSLSNNTASTFPNSVNVYPNPAGETLNVLVVADASVELVDINGTVVLSTTVKANQNLAINTGGIANGVYTLKVYNDTLVSIEKVVIAK